MRVSAARGLLVFCAMLIACAAAPPVANKPAPSAQQPSAPPPPPDAAVTDHPDEEAQIAAVNQSYDRGDIDDAVARALAILAYDPTSVRMLRVVVASECLQGDAALAQQYFTQLAAPRDRESMKTRCARYGITLTDPP